MSAKFLFCLQTNPFVYRTRYLLLSLRNLNSPKTFYQNFSKLLFISAGLIAKSTKGNTMEMEQIFPGIYLTLCEDKWTTDKLRTHGFTHIIRIDKHINSTNRTTSQRNDRTHPSDDGANKAPSTHCDSDHLAPHLDGFETLDLNFGETSYLTTVLPNCYKGVRFIDNALRRGGRVLIVDRITNEKCITVVVGFLMYKDNLKFR